MEIHLINENDEKRSLSIEVKKHFLEIVSTYNKYQEMMDRKSDLTTIAETLGGITEAAKTLAIHEGDDWFDKVTVKRNMNELEKLGKEFDKVAKEANSLDQRLNGLYEDMGHILSRYYKVGDISEDTMKERLGLKSESVSEASAPGEWVVFLSTNKGKKLLKTFKSATPAKSWMKQNSDKFLEKDVSIGAMTKQQWDEREAKWAIESVNEIKKGSVVIPYAHDKYGEFIVDKVFKNKDGEISYTGKFKKNGERREFILHSRDILVKESINEGVRISLFDPNKNKILKSLSLDRNYREAEKEIETLNKRLPASQKNKGYYWKVTTIGESVTRTAMEIGGLTGMNSAYIQKFVDTHKLDIEKVYQYVKRSNIKDRLDFVTAISGKPGNSFQTKLIKKLSEELTEAGEDINKAPIPGDIKIKLDRALDILSVKKLTYPQKLQIMGRFLDSLGIDKKELNKVSQKLRTKLESTENSIEEVSYDSQGNLKVKKQYRNLSDYENVANKGDYIWVGKNPNSFKGARKELLSKVLGKDSEGNVILTPFGRNKKYTIPQKDQSVVVVESVKKKV